MLERFEARLSQVGDCWIWTGTFDKNGYGRLHRPGRQAGAVRAHRFSYEYHIAEIPEGLTLDHLCRVPACVNPWHLAPVTSGENVRRQHAAKTHCKHGHEFTEANTARDQYGKRVCIECGRRRRREFQRAKRRCK